MRAAFSALFWIYLALGCIPLYLVAIVIWALTLPFDPNGRVPPPVFLLLGPALLLEQPFLATPGRGADSTSPGSEQRCWSSNHQSLGDILVLFGLWRPFKWVSKASNFNIPFIGWNMRLNRYVQLVRGDKESIAAMMRTCEEWLRRGVPLLLFPEGTRSPDGQVKAFKDGAFRLSIAERVPVIPIALAGTGDILPKHGWVLRGMAHCRVRVLPPVNPAPFGEDVAAFRDHVRTLIVEEKRRLEAEG